MANPFVFPSRQFFTSGGGDPARPRPPGRGFFMTRCAILELPSSGQYLAVSPAIARGVVGRRFRSQLAAGEPPRRPTEIANPGTRAAPTRKLARLHHACLISVGAAQTAILSFPFVVTAGGPPIDYCVTRSSNRGRSAGPGVVAMRYSTAQQSRSRGKPEPVPLLRFVRLVKENRVAPPLSALPREKNARPPPPFAAWADPGPQFWQTGRKSGPRGP